MKTPFLDLKIRTKSIVGLACVVLGLGGLNLITFELMRGHVEDLSGMIDVTILANEINLLSGKTTEGLAAEVEEYSLHPNAESRARVRNILDKINADLANLDSHVEDKEVGVRLSLLRNMFQTVTEKFAKIEELVDHGAPYSAINELVVGIKESCPLVNEGLQQFISAALSYDEITKAKQAQHVRATGVALILGIILTTLLSFLLYYRFLIEMSVLRPLRYLQQTMDKIANDASDIRLRVHFERNDEIGQLARYYNKMADTIQKYKEGLEDLVDQRTRQLNEAQAKLLQAGKLSALGEMAGGIAHEVNTPLATISLVTETLLEDCESEDPISREDLAGRLKTISSTVSRIEKIIRGLRSYSRNAANDPVEQVRVSTLVEETLSLCASKIKTAGVDLRSPALAEDLRIECRSTEISQVLLNLVSNAFDVVAGTESPWIQIDAQDRGDGVEISVTDSGHGIPEALKEKIFQPFFTTKDIGKGTGLGLSISSGIVASHGGRLWLDDSSPNTRFVIHLPRKSSPKAA
jgi:signal transduction histidine kinase